MVIPVDDVNGAVEFFSLGEIICQFFGQASEALELTILSFRKYKEDCSEPELTVVLEQSIFALLG